MLKQMQYIFQFINENSPAGGTGAMKPKELTAEYLCDPLTACSKCHSRGESNRAPLQDLNKTVVQIRAKLLC